MEPRILKLRKNPECPICSDNPTVTELIDYEEFCGIGRGELGQEDVQEKPTETIPEISVEEFAEKKKSNGEIILVVARQLYGVLMSLSCYMRSFGRRFRRSRDVFKKQFPIFIVYRREKQMKRKS